MLSPPPTELLGGATAVVDAGVLRPDRKDQRLEVFVRAEPGRIQAVKNGWTQNLICVLPAPIGGIEHNFRLLTLTMIYGLWWAYLFSGSGL